jgi:hypothetical protein
VTTTSAESFGGGVLIHIITAALIVANAFAEAKGKYNVTINGKSCEELVAVAAPAKSYTGLDYAVSDLEGLFFIYLEKMQNVNEVPVSRLEYVLKDLLNLKAEILNDAMWTLPQVAVSGMEEERKNNLLNSIYQIIDTMGVPAQVYGFQIDKSGQLSYPGKRRPNIRAQGIRPVEIAKDAIGFLGGKAPSGDLPEGVHRSIGFKEHTVSGENPPARAGGTILRSISKEKPNYVLIVDGEKGTVYHLPIARVAFPGGQAGGKVFQLDFNNQTGEWMVLVKNLNNPDGRIGFL